MRHQDQTSAANRIKLGLIGLGAFGSFALPHLTRAFAVVAHDPRPEGPAIATAAGARFGSLAEAARCRIVVLAVPLASLDAIARAIAPLLRRRALVIDTCSVKLVPLALLRDALPAHARIVGTHPLFGPRSGAAGIAGLQLVVCSEAPGRRSVARFARERLGLAVVAIGAEAHDQQMAHVQALSHLVARCAMAAGPREGVLATAASQRLDEIVGLLGDDSDALFETIVGANPFAVPVLSRFAAAAETLVRRARAATPST